MPSKIIYTEEFFGQVKCLFEQGLSRKDIAIKLNVSEFSVRKVCETQKLKHKSGRKFIKYPEQQKLCPGCNKNLSLDNFGLRKSRNNSPKTFCKVCEARKMKERRAEISKNKTYKRTFINYTEQFLANVQDLFNQGYGQINIAKKLGVKQSNIVVAYKKLGLYKSDLVIGKTNPRKTHLYIEYYCVKCDKILPISEFRRYENKKGLIKIKSLCLIHEREQSAKYSKNYLEKNRETVRKKKNERLKRKLKTDPAFKIKDAISKQIAKALKKRGKCKNYLPCEKFLPFTLEELIIDFEKKFETWMNWGNYGIYQKNKWKDNDSSTWTWQLDHIIPHSEFKYISMEDDEFKNCWSLENIRPYSSKNNVIDGATRVRHIL